MFSSILVSLCPVVGAFNPYTFKVIIVTYSPITIFLVVLSLFCAGLFLLLCFLPWEVSLAFVVKLVWWCWNHHFQLYLLKYILESSLSSPSGTLIMQMLVCLMLSQRSPRLFSLFSTFFFLYSVLQLWFPPFCPPGHLSVLLPQLFCCWFLLVYYSSLFVL